MYALTRDTETMRHSGFAVHGFLGHVVEAGGCWIGSRPCPFRLMGVSAIHTL